MAKKKKVKKGPPRKRPVAKGRAKAGGKKLDVYQRTAVESQEMARRSGGDFWNPPSGNSTIRILPFKHGDDEHAFVEDLRHWNLDPNNRGANVQCIGEDCPICTLVGELPEKKAGELRKRRKLLANAVVRRSPDHDDKDAQVLAQLPVSVYRELAAYIGGEKMHLCPQCLDPKKGRDFKITRSGKGKTGTKYVTVPLQAKSPIGMDVDPIDLIDRKEANMKTEEEIQIITDELEKLS